MIVYSRSLNDQLQAKMQSLLPGDIEVIPLRGFNRVEDCSNYLHEIIRNGKSDWIMNLDEDAYIIDWQAIMDLKQYMIENNYHYCGMPDGGACSTRGRSWVVTNPFFNLFNIAAIREKYIKSMEIDSTSLPEQVDLQKPSFLKDNYNHSATSPFNGLFNWLFIHFKPLYLPALNHSDGISTILLNHQGEPILQHGWYSREYPQSEYHRERIDRLYNEAKFLQSILAY